jgi:O-antigen biosynthesis protein
MTLSIVIVNYNVKYFLEQCLISVFKALQGIDAEVFVVDNASADGSCQMVRERFPNVILIENTENFGFSYANNQALRVAKSEYVLILNPDTVVEENTFSECIRFMEEHPEAGSLSVKMIDGKGTFLPESKRALPSPMVSFYKIFGLARLFPRSKVFARYHLGHLSQNEVHEIEILPGAFMFIRLKALAKAGLFDESFFMYGEDVDLSYRILNSGYKNYYLPTTTIIHYKGESTKKGSINYVILFYKAMMIFARKHFNQKKARFYISLIYIAIFFRASLSIIKRVIKRSLQPVIDGAIMAIGFILIIPFWESVRFNSTDVYPENLVIALSSLYVFIWLASIWLYGGYDSPNRHLAAAKGIGIGTILILIAYALLPETMRFSRAVILLSSVWSIVLVQIAHYGVGYLAGDMFLSLRRKRNVVIVGNPNEVIRVNEILKEASVNCNLIGEVSPEDKINYKGELGTLKQLPEIVRVNSIDEVIFCSGDISSQEIIKSMLTLVPQGVNFKIAPPDSQSVIGSNSIDTSGDLYTIEINAIGQPINRRFKRLFDISFALLMISLSPLLIAFNLSRKLLFKSLVTIAGSYTWVGYAQGGSYTSLPIIRKGVINIATNKPSNRLEPIQIDRINIQYAKNYSILKDLQTIFNYLINNNPRNR